MGKAKNKRNSGIADKVRNKRQADTNKKKLNPFEVHINREKIKVLGKKSKHDRGLPGVSRAKAIKKRKETLGTEMRLMNKTNTFIDRRIGEKDTELTAEDRMIARFTAERARQHSRKNIFNLADNEVLTHRGQTLEQIEKFDDPRSDEEDDDDKRKFGGLGDEFVAEGHFGGGVLSKTDSKDGAKSHKDLIEQLIAESKKRKAEKQKEKEQTLDLTEKLDTDWKDLQPVVFKRPRLEEKETESAIDKLLSQAEKKGEDYDKMMRELKFEKRGTPSDALKSAEKQAKEDQEKLDEWVKERQARMAPEEEKPKVVSTSKHRSADDLDDNFELDDEKQYMLAYDNEGKPLVPEEVLKNFSVPNAKPKFNDGISDTSDDEDDDESSDDEDDSKNKKNDETDDDEVEENEDDDKSKDDSESSDSDSESEPNKIEAKVTENGKSKKSKENNLKSPKEIVLKDKSKTKETKIVNGNAKTVEKGGLFQSNDKESSEESENDDEDDDEGDEDDEDTTKEESEDDMKDLKYSDDNESDVEADADDDNRIGTFFDMKTEEGDKLKELLADKTPAQQSLALQKLIKSYNPGLGEKNKDLLSRLFAHLLQYINDTFTNLKEETDVIKAFLIFDKIAPHLFDLVQTNKVSTKKYLAELLKEKRDKFMKHPKKIPDLDTLIFFKLVSILYPTSDFRHPIATPSLVFMTEILTTAKFNDTFSISRGFFLTALVLEYTVLSKRYVPSAVNFLRGVLYLCSNTTILNPVHIVPPFKLHRDAKLLYLEDDCSKLKIQYKMLAKDLVLTEIDSEFKIRALLCSCLMLKEFFDNYNEIQAQECMFRPHLQLLDRIDLELYPKKAKTLVADVIKHIEESLKDKSYVPMSREKVKPKALRLYEPDVQEVFTGSKSSKLSREMADKARLQTRYKKEMKGALREIRRDKAYVASVKIRQKIHSDNIRKDKVKQIYKDASIQQGELNKMKRQK